MSDKIPRADEPSRGDDSFDEFWEPPADIGAPVEEPLDAVAPPMGAEDAGAPSADTPPAPEDGAGAGSTETEEPSGPEVAAPDTSEGTGDPGGGGDRKARRARWPWLFLGLLIALLLVVGWTKTVNSASFCTVCHATQSAAETASHSVHSDVSCIACHRGVGIPGAVAYIPTFAREVVQQVTGLHTAGGVMVASDCTRCHSTIFTSPLLKDEHPSTGCPQCHGDSSHPVKQAPNGIASSSLTDPHPSTWTQLHGRAATEDPGSCATCHPPESCMTTCHFQLGAGIPHPNNWITIHGAVQQRQGPEACTLCHSSTAFCASCHGTEIPHASDWLQQHPTDVLRNDSAAQCQICHAKTDCTFCHIRHSVHPSQGLYSGWVKR